MRTTKELLELMLKHKGLFRARLFGAGLHRWATNLFTYNLITRSELSILRKHIKKNKPDKTFSENHYWRKGEIAPRIEWINQQMLKLS